MAMQPEEIRVWIEERYPLREEVMIRVVNVTVANLRTLGLTASDVCYVGRGGRFHKWPHHSLSNPFTLADIKYRDLPEADRRAACLADYRRWLKRMGLKTLNDQLDALWEQCDGGKKPLGCWCIDATHSDGQPVVCHAQVLAGELHRRFLEGNA